MSEANRRTLKQWAAMQKCVAALNDLFFQLKRAGESDTDAEDMAIEIARNRGVLQ